MNLTIINTILIAIIITKPIWCRVQIETGKWFIGIWKFNNNTGYRLIALGRDIRNT